MKSTTVLLSTLAATALAQPHRHAHAPLHKKHAIEKRESTVVWVTDWEYVTETVPVTETIWVSSGYIASASTSGTPANFFETTTSTPAPQPKPTTPSSVYVAPPAPTVQTYVAPASPSISTPEPVVAPVISTPEAPAASPSPVAVEETPTYVAPIESPSPAPPAYTPPAPAPVYTAPAPAPQPTTYAPAPAPAPSPSTGECGSGTPCTGDITFYEAGLGACGWTNAGTEPVVALPHGLMGTQSNGNPYCGRMITVKYGGKTVVAKVVDKCMGCVHYDIDLSNAAFDVLAAESIGRTKAEWWFN